MKETYLRLLEKITFNRIYCKCVVYFVLYLFPRYIYPYSFLLSLIHYIVFDISKVIINMRSKRGKFTFSNSFLICLYWAGWSHSVCLCPLKELSSDHYLCSFVAEVLSSDAWVRCSLRSITQSQWSCIQTLTDTPSPSLPI